MGFFSRAYRIHAWMEKWKMHHDFPIISLHYKSVPLFKIKGNPLESTGSGLARTVYKR
jgi:hypothetical protein